jgi:hypothetical protein
MRLLALLALFGCGSSNGAADAMVDVAVDGANVTASPGAGMVLETSGAPIAGAKVCILDHAELPCVMSDATGAYTMTLPHLTSNFLPIAMNVTAPGHLGFTGLLNEATTQLAWFSMVKLQDDASAMTELATQAGFTYPAAGNGFVVLTISNAAGPIVGETATLAPGSGSGPVYFDDSGVPAPALTSTSSNGTVVFGDVTPGKIQIKVTGTDPTCSPMFLASNAWADPSPHAIDGEVAADSATQMFVICD